METHPVSKLICIHIMLILVIFMPNIIEKYAMGFQRDVIRRYRVVLYGLSYVIATIYIIFVIITDIGMLSEG